MRVSAATTAVLTPKRSSTRTVPEGALALDIYRADHTAFSKKLDRVVMMRDAPDHSPEDFVLLSGTKVREMLGQGIAPPPEFSRPEVAEILMAYYQELDGQFRSLVACPHGIEATLRVPPRVGALSPTLVVLRL